jgi:CheY-like chemotaxis protein
MKKTIALTDDAGVQHIKVRVLESEQYEVELTRTGPEAVATRWQSLGVLTRFTASERDGMNALRYWNLSPFRHKGGLS